LIHESPTFTKLAKEADEQTAAFYALLSEETLKDPDLPVSKVMFAQKLAEGIVKSCMDVCDLCQQSIEGSADLSTEQKNIGIAIIKTCKESIKRKFEIQE
jgi:hypothetical protein